MQARQKPPQDMLNETRASIIQHENNYALLHQRFFVIHTERSANFYMQCILGLRAYIPSAFLEFDDNCKNFMSALQSKLRQNCEALETYYMKQGDEQHLHQRLQAAFACYDNALDYACKAILAENNRVAQEKAYCTLASRYLNLGDLVNSMPEQQNNTVSYYKRGLELLNKISNIDDNDGDVICTDPLVEDIRRALNLAIQKIERAEVRAENSDDADEKKYDNEEMQALANPVTNFTTSSYLENKHESRDEEKKSNDAEITGKTNSPAALSPYHLFHSSQQLARNQAPSTTATPPEEPEPIARRTRAHMK